jgi:hypothetical protein
VPGDDPTFAVYGLSQGDRFELSRRVPAELVAFEDEPVPDDSAGEIALATAIVIGSAVGLKAFAQFLLWRHRGESFEETVDITRPDGTKVKSRLKWRKADPGSAEAEVVARLTSLADVPDLRSLAEEGS